MQCLLVGNGPSIPWLVRFPNKAEAQQDGLSQLVEPIASVWRLRLVRPRRVTFGDGESISAGEPRTRS